jgi:CRP-like cAMP-binding protein
MVNLKDCFLFKDLSPSEFESLLRIFKEKSYRPGEVLLEKNSLNSFFYILLEGQASVRESTPENLDIDIYQLKPGEFFGEISFIEQQPVSAKVVAHNLVRTLRVSFSDLAQLFEKNPGIEVKFLRQLALGLTQRIRKANKEIKNNFLLLSVSH